MLHPPPYSVHGGRTCAPSHSRFYVIGRPTLVYAMRCVCGCAGRQRTSPVSRRPSTPPQPSLSPPRPPPWPGMWVLNGREEGDARAPRHTLGTYDVHASRCPVSRSHTAAQPRLGRSPDRVGDTRCAAVGKPFTRSSGGGGMGYRPRSWRRSGVRMTGGYRTAVSETLLMAHGSD